MMGNPLDTVPEGVPATLVAGDTWTWQQSYLSEDFPPASYALSYSLQREGDIGAPTVIVAAGVGDIYRVTFAAADSAAKAAGTWRWVAYMVRTSDNARVAITTGVLTVKPNPAAAYDARSHAVKVLAAIESLIEGRASSGAQSYSIAGRSLTRLSPAELMSWRAYYRREIKRERDAANAASGKPNGRTQVVRFS